MTNEEIIREIRKLADKHKYDSILTFGINYHMAFTDIANHIVEQEKENDKLKAEIKQLKEDYSVLARQYDNVENSSIRYYNEVKQLKSELEQSVKLPCRVGDNIYFRVKGRNQFAEYVDFIQTQKITRIDINEDGILYCSATEKFIECDINKTIFLTREEAERHLKGKVEE